MRYKVAILDKELPPKEELFTLRYYSYFLTYTEVNYSTHWNDDARGTWNTFDKSRLEIDLASIQSPNVD